MNVLAGVIRPTRTSPLVRLDVAVAVLALALLTATIAVSIDFLLRPDRLVPVSLASIVSALPLAAVCYFCGLLAVTLLSDVPHRVALFSLAFTARVLVAALLATVFQYDDERLFHDAAVRQTYGLWSWDAGHGYNHLNNLLYRLFDANLLLPKAVNVLLGSLLPFLAYDAAARLFRDSKAAFRAFWFTALLPPAIIYSAVNLKEMPTAFLLLLNFWLLACWRRNGLARLAGSAACLASLYWLRGLPWTAAGLACTLVFATLGDRFGLRAFAIPRFWLRIALAGAIAAALLPFFVGPLQDLLSSRLTHERFFIERFTGSSATVMGFMDVSSPLSARNLFTLFFRGLYSPSPFCVLFDLSLPAVIETTNMAVWYVLFPFAGIGFVAARRKSAALACAVTALGVLVMANVGVAVGSDPYRHRFAMMPLLFALSAGGMKPAGSAWTRSILALWWLGAAVFTVLWIAFRS